MAIKLTPESFLNVVKQSNLVTGDVLKRLYAELKSAGAPVDTSRAIAEQMVERELLTRWQADKLLQGKHKGFFLGKYRLLRLLGKGGMSSVYLAEHVLMRRQCAIKVLPTKRVNDTSYLGRFHREAQAVASLDHPNIIKAYDVDKEMEKDAEIHFLVMEFVEGRSLQEVIQQDGPLDYQTTAEYIRQSAAGLAHAHEAGMVHRDIKPGNLLIDRNGVVKLLDMGLARFFNDDEEESLTVAHDEKVLGTADYLAPEQALDSHSVDARADLYSLGCTMYFLLTGHPPFTEGTLAQRLMSHQTKQPPRVTEDRPDMPADLLAILDKMMAKKREERYQTAAEISTDLAVWLNTHGTDAWHQANPGLSGSDRRLSDSGSNLSSSPSAPDVPPVAQPAVPIAMPVVPPAETSLHANSEPTTSPANELSSFLASLGGETAETPPTAQEAPPQLDIPAATPVATPPQATPVPASSQTPVAPPAPAAKAVPVQPEPAQPVPTALPAQPVAKAVPAQPEPAQPVPTAPPVQPEPVQPAANAVPVVVDEPEFPGAGNEFAIDTSPGETAPTITRTRGSRTKQKSKPATKPAASGKKSWLKDKRILAGVGGVLALLLGLGVYWIVANAGESPEQSENGNSADGAPAPAGKNLMGQDILVGKSGSFQTLNAALDYVKKHGKDADSSKPQIIRLAAGEKFPDRINRSNRYFNNRDFPNGIVVHIVSDPQNPATLKPEGPEPVIRLEEGIKGLEIHNIKIAAEGKPIAIQLEGSLEDTKLINLKLTGYTQIGIEAKHVFGGEPIDGKEQPLLIDGVIFQGGPNSVGLSLESGQPHLNQAALAFLTVQNCQFLGPMKTGLEVKHGARNMLVLSNIFASEGTGLGIQFTGTAAMVKTMVGNNTFYKLAQGVAFSDVASHSQFGLHRNLFVDIKSGEVAGKDPKRLAPKISTEGNYTTDKAPGKSAKEFKLFTSTNGKAGITVDFGSEKPGDSKFLTPQKPPAPPGAAPAKALGNFSFPLQKQVGAK